MGQLPKIQQTASALAQLDVLASFAETARLHNYCRPQISDDGVLQIRDGRHPVLEQQLVEERFVPNDVALASVAAEKSATDKVAVCKDQIALITGPNMAGKSTYIRQVALLTPVSYTHLCAHAHRSGRNFFPCRKQFVFPSVASSVAASRRPS